MNGKFNTINKASQRLFEGLTGISLGKTNREADEKIREYAKVEIEQYVEEVNKERDERLRKEKEESDKKKKELIDGLIFSVSIDQPILGEHLVELCKYFDIKIHPRTVSVLKKRVISVNSHSSEQYGKDHVNSIYQLYRECQEKCKEKFQEKCQGLGESVSK